MIINTGSRTDIPAYFSEWFCNRIKEGYVCMRNPYYPTQVTKYRLDPAVVDCLVFCTKNPAPMLKRLQELDAFGQYWFVTITPYGTDIEPHVPPKDAVMQSFVELSGKVGPEAICWRYDPVFLSEKYTYEFHEAAFSRMAERLAGHTKTCVISFIDLYEKTLRNFKGVKAVERKMQQQITKRFVEIGNIYGIKIKTCAEAGELARCGADCSGCLTKEVIERALGESLDMKKTGRARESCPCLLGNDIGMYNTCGHGCLYCYANYDNQVVAENRLAHDKNSPFLVGRERAEDTVREAKQESYRSGQLKLFL